MLRAVTLVLCGLAVILEATPVFAQQPSNASLMARTHFQLGAQYERSGQLGKSIEEYRNACEADPSFLDAYIQLGNLLVKNQRYAEAAEIYRRAITVNPRRADFQLVLGDIAKQLGDTVGARAAYAAVLAIEPTHVKATLELARFAMKSGDVAEAMRVLEANRLLSNDPAALSIRAYCQHKLGRLSEAAVLYQRVLDVQPDNVDARLNLGVIEAGRGRFNEAVAQFQRAVLLATDKGVAYRYLGMAQSDAGHDVEAMESFRRAVSENGSDVTSRFRLASVLVKLGRVSDAVQQLETLRSTSGNFPELTALLGRAYLMSGNAARARIELEQAQTDHPGDTQVMVALAETYQKIGETARSIQMYEALIAMHVRMPGAYRALADLYASRNDAARALEYERLYQDQQVRSDVQNGVDAERRAWQIRVDELKAQGELQLAEAKRAADERVRAMEARSQEAITSLRDQVRSREVADTTAEWARLERLADERVERVHRELEAQFAARGATPSSGGTVTVADPDARRAVERAEARAVAAENELRRLRDSRSDSSAPSEIGAARQRVLELTAIIEKERATREEAQAGAERVRAEAAREVMTSRALVDGIEAEVWRGLSEISADTTNLQNESGLDRLKFYVQNVRLSADARVARAQMAAEQRLNEARSRAESQVERIMREAKSQVDRAQTQSAEEVRRIQQNADSRVLQEVTMERERLASEALARRMAQAEQLRASIEADAQVRFIEEKAKIEATYEADRIRMQRDYDRQLETFQVEYQRRLEAAQAEAQRASEQVEALTRNDTGLLMRSEVYQKLVRENAVLREDLSGARRRLEDLGRDKEELVREADGLRREFANVQARVASLEQESRRFSGIEVLAEPLRNGINLNTATLAELQTLPGVGIQEARNIVWYRENVGPFRGVEELAKVPGFEAAKAQALRALIKVR